MSFVPRVDRPTTILGLPGSLRRGSYNRLLLDAAAEYAPGDVAITVWNDLGQVPLFNEDLLETPQREPIGVQRLRNAIAEADGLLIATPEYNQSLPGVMKNVIDWLSMGEPDVLDGKPVAIIGATTGPWGTRLAQSVLRHVLTATGALILPQPQLYVREVDQRFDEHGQLRDEALRHRLTALTSALAEWIEARTPNGAGAA